jgi:glycosyltransferase involved in cell wall biosynthesis
MRILFVDTTTDSELIGGGHLILPSLMGALRKRGHEVHLVTKGEANDKLQPFIALSGATVHISPWKKKAPVEVIAPIFNQWIKRLMPDVYIISSSAAIGWVVLPYLDPALPTFTIGHNNENTFYSPVKHYHSFLTGAIGVSKQICREYVDKCYMKKEHVEWIPYGVEAAAALSFPEPESELRILYVGRIEEVQKRSADLVKIAGELYRSGVSYKLTVVGDGPYMPVLKENLKEEISAGVVELKGWLGKEDVMLEMRAAEIFILTSAFEGFSIALTEAMANGCCPVVTDIPSGNQQLIEQGINGYLIQVGDISGFKEKLSLLSTNKDTVNRMRVSAWKTGRQFSLERMAEHYERIFIQGGSSLKITPRKSDPNFPLMNSSRSFYPILLRILKSRISKRQTI